MTRTAGSGSRVSIPRDERSFLQLSRKEQSLPLRRHERNLGLAHFSFPPRSRFPAPWEASRCMSIRNSTQRAFKRDSCWPPWLSDAAPDPRKLGDGPVLISLGFGAPLNLLTMTDPEGNFGCVAWRRRAYQTVKAATAALWGSRRWRPGLPQGMALGNAWKHRLTAVQSGIAEVDVTVHECKPSSIDHSSGAGPFARRFANSWLV